MAEVDYQILTPKYFKQVIQLANEVHGEGYLTDDSIVDWVNLGIRDGINCGYVALLNQQVIGFMWPVRL